MSNIELRNCFLRIKAIANAIDTLLANNDGDTDENVNTLSMMLVEQCNEYESKDK